jgi:chorismate--pyruvate lyase
MIKQTKNNDWPLLRRPCPDGMADWLADPASFMQRLKRYGIDAAVEVVSQQWQFPLAVERELLGLAPREYALIREVIIKSDKTPWMFARTVFPARFLTGKEKRFAHLKSRSLGSLLFHDMTVTRSEFEFACLEKNSMWYQKTQQQVEINSATLWARRSRFFVGTAKSLLLTEIFLPSIERLS